MRRYAIGIAAAVALLAQQGSAAAQSGQNVNSANYVMPGCRDFVNGIERDLLRTGLCAGIVRPMLSFGPTKFGICPPNRVTFEQAVRVVIAYVDQRPARTHETFEFLAFEALEQAWPCRGP